jgi:hypothetical protein
MTVELDSRHPLLPKAGWENEDLTLILRKKNAHAKGAQYAAGGYIKREADLSVIRGRTSIQNEKICLTFVIKICNNQNQPGANEEFLDVESVPRNNVQNFKSIPDIRKIHCVLTTLNRSE